MPDSFMKPVESTEAQDIIGLDKLSFAYGQPAISAKLKQEYQDFLVDEQLGFEFSGQGEHLCVQVEKIDHSTVDVAKKLSEKDITHLDIRLSDSSLSNLIKLQSDRPL